MCPGGSGCVAGGDQVLDNAEVGGCGQDGQGNKPGACHQRGAAHPAGCPG